MGFLIGNNWFAAAGLIHPCMLCLHSRIKFTAHHESISYQYLAVCVSYHKVFCIVQHVEMVTNDCSLFCVLWGLFCTSVHSWGSEKKKWQDTRVLQFSDKTHHHSMLRGSEQWAAQLGKEVNSSELRWQGLHHESRRTAWVNNVLVENPSLYWKTLNIQTT